ETMMPSPPARNRTMPRRTLLTLAALSFLPPNITAAPRPRGGTDKMPLSGLAPSKIAPNLCVYKYRVSTTSPECQAFVDQGLGYFYSYVWMEAARSFETALEYDPNCPMAWWCLYRAFDSWKKPDAATKALLKANEIKKH